MFNSEAVIELGLTLRGVQDAILGDGSLKMFEMSWCYAFLEEKALSEKYDVSDEAFMVLEWVQGGLKNCDCMVRYRPEFNMVE